MDISKATAKMRAQAHANQQAAVKLNEDAEELVRQADAKADELREQAAEELSEAAYWAALADREAAKAERSLVAVQ